MFDKFQENILNDKVLAEDYFWKSSFEVEPLKEVAKPFEDLIDSYFALHCHKDNLESKKIVLEGVMQKMDMKTKNRPYGLEYYKINS